MYYSIRKSLFKVDQKKDWAKYHRRFPTLVIINFKQAFALRVPCYHRETYDSLKDL